MYYLICVHDVESLPEYPLPHPASRVQWPSEGHNDGRFHYKSVYEANFGW